MTKKEWRRKTKGAVRIFEVYACSWTAIAILVVVNFQRWIAVHKQLKDTPLASLLSSTVRGSTVELSILLPKKESSRRRRRTAGFRPPPTRNAGPAEPDLNGLKIEPSHGSPRVVRADDHRRFDGDRRRELGQMEEAIEELRIYSLPNADRFEHYDDITYPKESGCYRPKWSYESHPSCNAVHEVSLERPLETLEQSSNVTFLGEGHFRSTWIMAETEHAQVSNFEEDDLVHFVLKNQRLDRQRMFHAFAMYQTQIEALSMLKTSSSTRTIDIYGYCGGSVVVEAGTPIDEYMTAKAGHIDQAYLDHKQEETGAAFPLNGLSPAQKLFMALAMAEGLAELHGNAEGVIVNGDISPYQYLLIDKPGLLKLGDFNNVRLMEWNPTEQRYCKFQNHFNQLQRPPEELGEGSGLSDETADAFAFGVVLYTLVTGLSPHYAIRSNKEALDAIRKGGTPYIDPLYRKRSVIEHKLVGIMERCWEFEPEDRITMFQIVRELRDEAQAYKARQKKRRGQAMDVVGMMRDIIEDETTDTIYEELEAWKEQHPRPRRPSGKSEPDDYGSPHASESRTQPYQRHPHQPRQHPLLKWTRQKRTRRRAISS